MSIKNIFLTGLVAASTTISAQGQVTDSTAYSMAKTLASNDESVVPVSHNAMPTYENPRENSVVDLIKNKGLREGTYRDMNNREDIRIRPSQLKPGYIVVEFCDEEYVKDRAMLDTTGRFIAKHLYNFSYSQDESLGIQSYLLSVPMKIPGPVTQASTSNNDTVTLNNTRRSYENPINNSIIDIINNKGIREGLYKDANNKQYVIVYPDPVKWGYTIVEICDLSMHTENKLSLDLNGKLISKNLTGSDSFFDLESYLYSVPMQESKKPLAKDF